MRSIIYSVLILMVGVHSLGLAHSSILQRVFSSYDQRSVCSLEYISSVIDECDGVARNGEVPTGTQCRLVNPSDGTTYHSLCMHGSWLTQTKVTNPLHYREKRFFGWIIRIVCSIFCRSNRGDRGRTTEVVNSAPQFTADCPTIGGIIAAAKGSTSVTVSWIDPTATDPDKDKVTITQASGNAKGSIFQEGQHTIVYLAEDSKGNKDFCFMSFTVVVSRCTPLQWPRNGHKYCDGNDYWGSTCTITCDEGYEIQGLQSLTCEQNGHYSGSTPTCSRTKCLTPDEPEHGQASCSRQDFSFGSICLSHCDYGYTATVFKFSECLENKNWSNTLSTCDDIQPPRIACPGIIKVYTDQSSDTANVTWDEPIATDNSGGDVTVQPIDDTYASGSLFPVGLTPVSYRAVDEAGNTSPMCTVMVMVIVENLSCPPPIITDKYILIECPSESFYNVGSICSLSCLANFPLIGPTTITCERMNDTAHALWTWNWQQEPSCEQRECPELHIPLNGALSCSSGNGLTFCFPNCNEQYDISSRVKAPAQVVCGVEGTWSSETLPDCSEKRNPEKLTLPSEMYYYGGPCGDEGTEEEIKNKFIARIEELQKTREWTDICQEISCDIDSIEIFCEITENRKREVETGHRFKFMILARVHDKLITRDYIDSTELALLRLAEVMGEGVKSGTFDIDGLELRPHSFASEDLSEWGCPYGQSTEMENFYGAFCVGCPIGTFYDGQDVCLSCPRGTYRDTEGEITCTDCPKGTWTSHDGAVNASSCKDICQAGSYSLTGLSPCSHCPIGEYQFATMAQNCSVCPPGTITKTEFSKMDSECLEFDMLIYPHGVIYVDNLAETEGDGWTMATWLYFIFSTGYIHMSFDRDTSMNYSSHSLAIKMQNTTVETTMVAVIGQWHHIAVRTSATAGNIAVFVNGTLVELMDAIPANSSKVSVSHLEISYKGPEKTGVKISGFNFGTSPLTDDNILILSSSCNVFHPNAHTTMSELSRGTIKDVDLIIPSECGEGDACQDQPCGNNACVTERSGYVCYCSGGFTGDHCEIPPDYCVGNMCQNGATCRSRNENYTCDCRPGYSGEMCHDAPVNGQWRQWTDWSVCNTTCGGGTVTRQRFCDSPPPDEYGVHCGGYDLEYAVCNIQECPSCTELKRPYGSHLVCEKNDDMTYCNLTCRDGYTFLPGQTPKQLYDCGIQTDYKWQHTSNDNPLGDLPGCSKIGPANRLSTKTQSTYIDFSCDKEDDARTALVGNLESLPCVSNLTCSMEVAINGCDKVNRRRRATNSVNSIITLTIPIEGGDLDLAAFFENKTVSDTLSQMIQAINELEMAVLALESNVHLFLDIDVDSTTYHVDSATVITIPGVDCRDGSVPVEAFCVECTPGTFYNDGRCLLCGKGMYQDQFGQSSCIQCPEEKTTPGKGSASITYCHTSKATEFTKTKKDGDSVFVTLMVIVTVVIVGLVIGCICHRKLKRAATQNKVRPKSDHPPSYDEAIAVLPKVEM